MDDTQEKCEVCGKDATIKICDAEEVEPKQDGKSVWRCWRPTDVHTFCKEHARPPIKKYRYGTPEEIAEAETNRLWFESLSGVLK